MTTNKQHDPLPTKHDQDQQVTESGQPRGNFIQVNTTIVGHL